MSRWSERRDVPRGDEYDNRWKRLEEAGESIHGEADLIESLGPASVLDAGCGTGRVARELHRRGIDVVGVDLDPVMLDTARSRAPEIRWIEADLLNVTVEEDGATRRFDLVALPGNVMIFLTPGTEGAVVMNLAQHLRPGGLMVAGFQLKVGRYQLASYDSDCAAAGFTLVERWSTWSQEPFSDGDYAVSVHRLDAAAP